MCFCERTCARVPMYTYFVRCSASGSVLCAMLPLQKIKTPTLEMTVDAWYPTNRPRHYLFIPYNTPHLISATSFNVLFLPQRPEFIPPRYTRMSDPIPFSLLYNLQQCSDFHDCFITYFIPSNRLHPISIPSSHHPCI